jgi:hypothetical protein
MAKAKATKRQLKERAMIEWVILAVLLLLLLFFILAPYLNWWPHTKAENLGTAFYSGLNGEDATSTTTGTGGGSGTGSGGGSGGGSGNGGSGGGSGSSSSALLNFSAGVNNGDTKEQVSGEGQGLNENCALLVQSSSAGKQEVCTYTEGDKVVTVTFLNDRVVSASRSGF